MEFVDLMFYSALAGATRGMLEARAPKRLVVRLREELLMPCQGYAAKSWFSTSASTSESELLNSLSIRSLGFLGRGYHLQ